MATRKTSVTLILIHGAGLGSWIWKDILPYLSQPAVAIDLPGRQGKGNTHTFEAYVQVVIDAIQRASTQKVILVGHSIGAELALTAASRIPEKVASIIVAAGLIPESGQSYYSLLPLPQRLFLWLLSRISRNGIKPPNNLISKAYANDLNSATIEKLLDHYAYESPQIFSARIEWNKIPNDVPRAYIRFLKDRSGFSPTKQAVMAKRLGASKKRDMQTGHLGMLSQPKEFASIINYLTE